MCSIRFLFKRLVNFQIAYTAFWMHLILPTHSMNVFDTQWTRLSLCMRVVFLKMIKMSWRSRNRAYDEKKFRACHLHYVWLCVNNSLSLSVWMCAFHINLHSNSFSRVQTDMHSLLVDPLNACHHHYLF